MRKRPMRGVVTLEFIVAIATVLTLLMGLLQVGHGHVARLLVNHAAEKAARAAAVWVHEVRIGEAQPGVMLERVNAAAALAMTPVSPPMGRRAGLGVHAVPYAKVARSLGAGPHAPPGPFRRASASRALDADVDPEARVLSKLAYAFHATDVAVETSRLDQGRVGVTVEYAYYCAFPFANVLYGRELSALVTAGGIDWRTRLLAAGLPPSARVRILRGEQEHFFSALPAD